MNGPEREKAGAETARLPAFEIAWYADLDEPSFLQKTPRIDHTDLGFRG